MRLEDLNAPLFRSVVEVFLKEAWGDLAASHHPGDSLPDSATSDAVLKLFTRDDDAGQMRKYWLRIGNRRYPFMKLNVQELFLKDIFYFAVDTHDDLDIGANSPDYHEWLEVRKYNAELRDRIEAAWAALGIPTFLTAVEAVERSLHDCVPAGSAAGRSVLVVDDDRRIARGVQMILTHCGYEVTVVYTGADALDFLKSARPDLLLVDYELGAMMGTELIKRIRANPETRGTKIILATAARLDPQKIQAMDAADAFLAKPFDKDVLLDFVARTLSAG